MHKFLNFLVAIALYTIPCLSIMCDTNSTARAEKENLNKPFSSVFPNNQLSVQIDSIIVEAALLFHDTFFDSSHLFNQQLDSAAKAILSKSEFGDNQLRRLEELRNCVFNVWQIKFSPEQNSLHSIIPHQVFIGKAGSCLGISLIFLLLAEKINLPLYGVLAPGHFFVRYDDGNTQLNIETLRNGEYMSDSWYKDRYRIVDTTLYKLSNLSTSAVLAALRYNIGNYCLANSWYGLALKQYNLAIQLNPSYIEAQGNRAIATEGTGDTEGALKDLLKLKRAYPELVYLHKNLGTLYLKRKFYRKAIHEYRNALRKTPTDPELLYGLGVCYFYSGQIKKAEDVLNELLLLIPDHHDANILLSSLKRISRM